jgi:hypothetical protein
MTHATMPDLSLDATAKADDWGGPQGSCKVLRQAVDLLGCRRGEAAIRCRIQAVALTDRRKVALTWAAVECSLCR